MSSFLCFVCHSTVNADTNEETREKYREVIGMHLCPDSHLCYICCHFLNKMCLFKSICLKRSLEYPVLFSEKGTINLHKSDTQVAILCPEDFCIQHLNSRYHFHNTNDNSQSDNDNEYVQLHHESHNDNGLQHNDNDDFHNDNYILNNDNNHDNYILNNDNFFNDILPLTETKDHEYNHIDGSIQSYDISRKIMEAENELFFKNPDQIIPVLVQNGNSFKNPNQNIPPVLVQSENNLKNPDQIIPVLVQNENNFKNPDQIIPVLVPNDINQTQTFENDNMKNETTQLFHNDNMKNETTQLFHNDMKNETAQLFHNDNIKNDAQTDLQETEIQNDNYNYIENNDNDITYNEYIDNDNDCNDTESLAEDDPEVKKKDFEKIVLSVEEQKKELKNNRKSKKYIESDFKCHSCSMGFLIKDSYQAHMMRHEESNGEHRCTICGLRFASLAVLRAHGRNHAARYRCGTCDVILRYRQTRTHVTVCMGRKVQKAACHLCGKVFPSVSHFQQHLKRVHQSKNSSRTYPCNQCGKTFTKQAALRTHMLTHVNKKFTCDICNSVLSSPYTLIAHKKTHVSAELHHCATCKLSFTKRKYLLAHFKRTLAHKDSVYKCSVCARSCLTLELLQSHISAVHERSKHLTCTQCPARYSTRKGLLRHMRNHKTVAQKKTPLCHVCGEKFKTTNNLKRHLKTVCEKDKMDDICDYYEQ